MPATTDLPARSPDTAAQKALPLAFGLVWGGALLWLLTRWLHARVWDDTAGAVYGTLALALASFGLAAWLALSLRDRRPEAVRQRRRAAAVAALALSGLLVLLMIWVASQHGWAAFPEFSSGLLLAAVGLAAGFHYLGDTDGAARQEAILLALLRNQRPLLVVLLALAAVLAVVGVWVLVANGWRAALPEGGGAILIALVLAGAGAWLLLSAGTALTTTNMRAAVLAVGGLTGFIIAAMTVVRALMWWNEVFAGGITAWQGEGAWRLWLCFYALLLGLAIIFGSLMLGRADIRFNPALRRLLFGYNTALTGMLLLAMLVVLNITVYASFPNKYEWSKTRGFYDLEDRTRRTLENLKETTTVYVLMPPGGEIYRDVRTLLENAQSYTNKLQVEYISPDIQRERFAALIEKYPKLKDEGSPLMPQRGGGRGLLIVYGPPRKSGPEPHAFIPAFQLVEDKPGRSEEDARLVREFRGEDLLMTELRFLARDQQKPVIYFTQGHDELAINNSVPGDPQGAGMFVDSLKQDRYEVKGLSFSPPPKEKGKLDTLAYTRKSLDAPHEVPADARLVIVAQPMSKFTGEELDALDKYVAAGGKMMVLSNLPIRKGTYTVLETGVENFLKKYGVDMGKDFVLRYSLDPEEPPVISVAKPPANSSNPIAKAFKKEDFVVLVARTVRPSAAGGAYQADAILEVRDPPNRIFWAETNYGSLANISRYVRGLTEAQVDEMMSPAPLPVGVAVSDRKGQPAMVVYGDAFMISNDTRFRSRYFDLMTSSIEWLAGRPENIGIQPRKSSSFEFRNVESINFNRMILLPVGLVMVLLVGMGTGVWLVRRR